MLTHPRPRLHPLHPKGFSLIAVVILMVLIAIIALGLVSLSTITLRESYAQNAQSTARANARLALMMALGELQKNLGPDGRVSAEMTLFDQNPSTPEIEQVANPHWLGVWEASRRGANGKIESPWSRDDSDGGLRDARTTGGWSRDSYLQCLVSGPTSQIDPRNTQATTDWVMLVGSGTTTSPADEIRVPTVQVAENGTVRGRYAWWIGDEGMKAKVNVPNAYPTGDGYRHWVASQTNHLQPIDAKLELPEPLKEKTITRKTYDLASGDATASRRFFDFTPYSMGLQVNIREARLKRDLTAYLNGNGAIPDLVNAGVILSPGLSDSDRMVGPANSTVATNAGITFDSTRHRNSSPRYGLLRKWSQKSFSLGESGTAMIEPRGETTPVLSGDDTYDGTNRKPTAVLELDTPNLTPVLVEGSLYYNLTCDPMTTPGQFQLCVHLYPRVAIWNPYNIAIDVPQTSIMIQTNNGKRVELTLRDGTKRTQDLGWGTIGGALGGCLYFPMDAVRLEPGACAVFSPVAAGAYNPSNFGSNRLSPTVAPSPDRGLRVNVGSSQAGEPTEFREIAGGAGAEDYRMLWKLGPTNTATFNAATFNTLSQISFVSCALQLGTYKELPVQWNSSATAPVTRALSLGSYPPLPAPDTRTRDGFRLRWWKETDSNKLGSGKLANTAHFDTATLANWNPRAAYAFRTPFENITDLAPNFFGCYTRDLFDGAVSWNDLTPVFRQGIQQGFPFGQPMESPGPLILFDVPRKEVGIVSLAQFQHAKVSEFSWHPSYAIGNSLADPRLERRLDRSAPVARNSNEALNNGFNQTMFGYAAGRSPNNDKWAFYARWAIAGLPQNSSSSDRNEAVVYDQSFELNQSLWDDFFLSSGTKDQKDQFVDQPSQKPLPNGRMRLINRTKGAQDLKTDLGDFHRAAHCLAVEGAFNVNSTSVDAWKAVLASTRGTGSDTARTMFPRLLKAPGAEWKNGDDEKDAAAWSGSRTLDDTEIDRLARAIVTEVKTRGPFLSLGDFVNRRLINSETGKAGTLESAIRNANLNQSFDQEPLFAMNRSPLGDFSDAVNNIADLTRSNMESLPPSKAWGATTSLTQADILQPLGPMLSARSDTFIIRTYGESRSPNGTIQARAWQEAVVQRMPQPLNPDASGLNPVNAGSKSDFGRQFVILSTRWLSPDEI